MEAVERIRVTKSLRFDVLNRDRYTCQYCGAKAPDVALELDHRIPVAAGGSSTFENLVTACHACNLGKSSKVLSSPEPRRAIKPTMRSSFSRRKAYSVQLATIPVVKGLERPTGFRSRLALRDGVNYVAGYVSRSTAIAELIRLKLTGYDLDAWVQHDRISSPTKIKGKWRYLEHEIRAILDQLVLSEPAATAESK